MVETETFFNQMDLYLPFFCTVIIVIQKIQKLYTCNQMNIEIFSFDWQQCFHHNQKY